MRVLVTGGAGFIGSHVTRRLVEDGHEVVVLDHRFEGKCLDPDIAARCRLVEADACVVDEVRPAIEGCERAYHFAALVGVEHYTRNPVRTMKVEERALEAVCAAAIAEGCPRLVYASSSAVYGNASGVVDEEMAVAPASNYATAKRFGEMFLRAQYDEAGLQSVACRIFNVYGPKQDERLVIPRFIHRALAGEALTLYGDGAQARDFPYIDDVVEAIARSGEAIDGCELVNVATGRAHSIRELAETVLRLTGHRARLDFQPLPPERRSFEVDSCVGGTDKLERLTGFRPAVSLEEGLSRTIAAMGP
jgi:UDP-glucose 4-epimerase